MIKTAVTYLTIFLMHSSSDPMEWGVDITYYNYCYHYLFITVVDVVFGLWLWGCLFFFLNGFKQAKWLQFSLNFGGRSFKELILI